VAAPSTDLSIRADEAGASVGSYLSSTGVLVRAAGDFDVATLPILEQAIARARTAALDVQLDLSGVTFFDAASLGVLVRARRSLAQDGRAFTIVNPARTVTRLLKITELEGLLRPADRS
jgi:anti-anti-sigma factor